MPSRTHMALVVLFSCFAGISVATAQTYSTRNITIIVPFSPGGATDLLACQIEPRRSAKLGQNMLGENVTGGGTNIGALREAMSDPQLLKEWQEQGFEASPKNMATPAGGEKFYRGEIARWREVSRRNKISVN